MQQKKLELLAPAGDWERLEMALAYGADAVYLAGNTFRHALLCGELFPGGAAPGGKALPGARAWTCT